MTLKCAVLSGTETSILCEESVGGWSCWHTRPAKAHRHTQELRSTLAVTQTHHCRWLLNEGPHTQIEGGIENVRMKGNICICTCSPLYVEERVWGERNKCWLIRLCVSSQLTHTHTGICVPVCERASVQSCSWKRFTNQVQQIRLVHFLIKAEGKNI